MNKAISLLLALAGTLSLLGAAQAQTLKGDAQAGAKKNAMCIGCHGIPGYHTNFPEVYHVPMISGQNGKYIAAVLDEYRKGDRKHPSMRGIAGSLSDQDIADLAAYYSSEGAGQGPAVPAQAELPADLKGKLTLCVACHGPNFNNTTDPGNPRLAGQYADYLVAALTAYRTSDSPVFGRSNPTMVGMAKTLTDAEVSQVANYLASLPGEVKTVPESRFR